MLVGILLSIGTDAVMHAIGYFPPIGQSLSSGPLISATIYRAIYGIIGAYVASRIAPNRPMLHVMVLGTLCLIVCIAGAVITWNRGPEFGPHWYPVALIVLALPTAWLGGKLGERSVATR